MSPEALAATVLRLTAAAIFIAQGWRKTLSPAGADHGRDALAAMLTRGSIPGPQRMAVVIGGLELIGGAAMLAGLGVRLVAIPLAVILGVAIAGFKREAGFLGGWDWPLSVLAIVLAVFLLGAGPWSLDAALGIPA